MDAVLKTIASRPESPWESTIKGLRLPKHNSHLVIFENKKRPVEKEAHQRAS